MSLAKVRNLIFDLCDVDMTQLPHISTIAKWKG